MNPITNSTYKESIRQRNEASAREQENQIRARRQEDQNRLRRQVNIEFSPFGTGGVILGIVFWIVFGSFSYFWDGLFLGVIAYFGLRIYLRVQHSNNRSLSQRLQDQANNEIRQAYNFADQRTMQEISDYDRDVQMYAQRVQAKAANIMPMADHTVMMFQRMISHADSGRHKRFIEADLTFQVYADKIAYSYTSQYCNPQDDFVFNIQRYRDLSSPPEYEGLAQVLAKLVNKKMKSLYPANSINITLDHNDARVTLHFKGANPNFVPARDIM